MSSYRTASALKARPVLCPALRAPALSAQPSCPSFVDAPRFAPMNARHLSLFLPCVAIAGNGLSLALYNAVRELSVKTGSGLVVPVRLLAHRVSWVAGTCRESPPSEESPPPVDDCRIYVL